MAWVVGCLLLARPAAPTVRSLQLSPTPGSYSLGAQIVCDGDGADAPLVAWRRIDGAGPPVGQQIRCAPGGATTSLVRFAAGREHEVVVVEADESGEARCGEGDDAPAVALARWTFAAGDGGLRDAPDGGRAGASTFADVSGAPSFELVIVDLSLWRRNASSDEYRFGRGSQARASSKRIAGWPTTKPALSTRTTTPLIPTLIRRQMATTSSRNESARGVRARVYGTG